MLKNITKLMLGVLLVGLFLNVAPAKANAPKPDLPEPKTTSEIIRCLIDYESDGRNVVVLDVNGKYSYGILQFQWATWNWFSKLSGIKGEPMNKGDAIRMATWAVENGYGYHWSTWDKCRDTLTQQ